MSLITALVQESAPRNVVFVYLNSKGHYLAAVAKINFDYGAELNAQQLADGQEITAPGKRSWGEKVPNSPLVSHKGKFYLSVWVTQNIVHVDDENQIQDDVLGYRDLKIEGIQTLIFVDKIL